jgi:hypothetical protein
MGAGLYDAAFATLGRLFGRRAHTGIAALTLFGGFASTICWPISALTVSTFGWRTACLIYAGVQLFVSLPLYLLCLPKEPRREPSAAEPRGNGDHGGKRPVGERLVFLLMALVITITSVITTLLSVHLLTLLQARGVMLVAAVALGAIVGPAQVGARVIEMLISRFHHPIWALLASAVFVAAGVGLLWAGAPIIAGAIAVYGAGAGIWSIARGTLPLAVFGERRFPSIMGRIAAPSLILQAATPSFGAALIEHLGATGALGVLLVLALVNALLAICLLNLLLKPFRAGGPATTGTTPSA